VNLDANYRPEYDSLKALLLEMAQIRSLGELMQRVVTRMVKRPHVALARVWVVDRGDLCATCPACPDCGDRRNCLHLVASAGRAGEADAEGWKRLDGWYRRIPIGEGKIGWVAARGQPLVITNIAEDAAWPKHPDWMPAENIRGFDAQPIMHDGQVLGVLALFTRIPTTEEGPAWVRILADSIAAALVNARAFEEIERLRARLELENSYLREEVREAKAFGQMLGNSPAWRQVLRQIDMVAPTEATVLIQGESGTGKELVAREVHRRSRRHEQPLIRVNCASVPRELFESEFFGHVKGAFTGAVKDRAGRFEAASGGTLFLDEVGEIPWELQSKFLRVLQEKQYERVGEERTRSVDVRIIAATNRELQAEVAAGRFRQDLYYRLNVFPIVVAPLRARREDIPLLADYFLELAVQRLKLAPLRIVETQARLLQNYDWPGNVRELQNVIERAAILAQGGSLQIDIAGQGPINFSAPAPSAPSAEPAAILSEREWAARERANVEAALESTGWKIHGPGGAAELLGVKPTTLVSRIKRMGLKRPGPPA
jgi:transcriptional regulator with GAF, ATPase, and Fis domain